MKNQYGHKYGYHTPKMTEKYATKINEECKMQFECCSWHNDTVDSLLNGDDLERLIYIYLPNTEDKKVDHFTKFNNFGVIINLNEPDEVRKDFDTIEEVITFINQID
jgi:hypothetical protein